MKAGGCTRGEICGDAGATVPPIGVRDRDLSAAQSECPDCSRGWHASPALWVNITVEMRSNP
jgi:hypothetical protein